MTLLFIFKLSYCILFVDLQEFVPVIGIMCNKGVCWRHWERMSSIAGFDLTPESGSTLRKVLQLELEAFMAEFENNFKMLYFKTTLHWSFLASENICSCLSKHIKFFFCSITVKNYILPIQALSNLLWYIFINLTKWFLNLFCMNCFYLSIFNRLNTIPTHN